MRKQIIDSFDRNGESFNVILGEIDYRPAIESVVHDVTYSAKFATAVITVIGESDIARRTAELESAGAHGNALSTKLDEYASTLITKMRKTTEQAIANEPIRLDLLSVVVETLSEVTPEDYAGGQYCESAIRRSMPFSEFASIRMYIASHERLFQLRRDAISKILRANAGDTVDLALAIDEDS